MSRRYLETMRMTETNKFDWRGWLLLAVCAAVCAGLVAHGPIPQDQGYHRFADGRAFGGIANAWNVASNLPFLFFGAWGAIVVSRCRSEALPMRPAYFVFFVGASTVAFGSAYYHLAPNDATLVWDRLPMTIAFMAFFAAIVGRHIHATLGARGLAPLLLVGLGSVIWWRASGDLRVYLLVQFLPILLIPAIFLLYPSKSPGTRYLWAVLGFYALAKILETYDAPVYDALGMSGHALKHLSAALGVGCVARAVQADAARARS